MDMVNQFDLAFIVDTTGSMGDLIQAAQRRMIGIVDALAKAVDVNIRLGVVEYRDHPPQDTMIYRAYAMTANLGEARKYLDSLQANGGGDEPEAVLAGVVAACERLAWRRHARRMALLVGDAPPHGLGARGDSFAAACPSGETIESASAKAEQARITLHALGLRPSCYASFERLSGLTGGRFYREDQGGDAMEQVQAILDQEFGQLGFDRQIYGVWQETSSPDIERIAAAHKTTPPKVASAVCRLQSRGLLLAGGGDAHD